MNADPELSVRPIEPGDKDALLTAFSHLSEESRYRRFLAPITRLTASQLAYLTELDHQDHEALIALTPEGEIVGVARYIRDQDRPGAAEVAVTVADDWQRRGIGTALLHRLAQRARDAGIESFVGYCLAENQEMLQLLDEVGPVAKRRTPEGGTIEVEVELPSRVEPEHARPFLRAVAQRRAGPR